MMKFAPEGYPFIGTAFFMCLVVLFLPISWFYVLIPFVLTLFMFYFFRDPERQVHQGNDIIVSPADGRILSIKEVYEDIFIKNNVIKISIFMSPLNVHVNRVPFSGKVKNVVYTPGSFKKAFLDEASTNNENIAMTLETSRGDMVVRQIAGAVARRAVCRVKPGEILTTGQKYGIIKFSSRVDLYLPLDVEVLVKEADIVRGCESAVAKWKKTNDAGEQ